MEDAVTQTQLRDLQRRLSAAYEREARANSHRGDVAEEMILHMSRLVASLQEKRRG